MEDYKKKLLEKVREHIGFVRERISKELAVVRVFADRSLKEIYAMRPDDKALYMDLKRNAEGRVEELSHLDKSPYFTKCETIDPKDGKKKTYFFGKHQFSEESIYSWIAPVAAIRFEVPGEVSYKLPDGKIRTVRMMQKEQYMIVDGKVVFLAEEKEGLPRELIYQEHFTTQKSGFILPEIVAQMEKAQDQVIRAHHWGPLVISGPAGSGKTTLALHRVAYLSQAPDTAPLYPAARTVVFVQDNGTKEYFSHLLPELGIHNVTITTFGEWALKVLDLDGYSYVNRYGDSEEEKDSYEYQKIAVLRSGAVFPFAQDPFAALSKLYKKTFGKVHLALLDPQKKEKKLDRFDVTILLKSYLAKNDTFVIRRSYFAYVGDAIKKKTDTKKVSYSLMVVDEFQNYLPEQLEILKRCLSGDDQSTIYVGDMAQQVQLGTIQDWQDIGETITPERSVRLDKVYRNTRHILSFIQSLGYVIQIPEGIKEGPKVLEVECGTAEEEIAHIMSHAARYEKGSVGVLAKDSAYLEPFRKTFEGMPHIHVLTMSESQGVEFDMVCIVGISSETFAVAEYDGVSPNHILERKRMQKDLLYVALTRAITELHVLGREKLIEIKNRALN